MYPRAWRPSPANVPSSRRAGHSLHCETPRFFRVRLVTKLERLVSLHVEHSRERNPPGQQRDSKPKSDDKSVPRH